MTNLKNPESALSRVIGKLGYSAISINGVIGAGIFGLPAVAAARVGAFSPWVFLVAGLLIFTVVLSFARAASMVRETGGVVVYATKAFGPFFGFQAGWLGYLSRVASVAANTNLLVTYASWFWAPLDVDPGRAIAVSLVIGGLTWLNVVGVKNSIGMLYVFTALKLLPLSLLILFGLGHIDLQMLAGAEIPEVGSWGETILVVLYAYVGFEGTVVTAGEGRSPRRDMPRALIDTIIFIGVIYVLVQVVSISVLPDLASSPTALADVANVLFGGIGATILTMGAIFSIGGNTMSSIISAPRMMFALARDGSMPASLARVHEQHHTPHVSILLYGALSLALALSGSFIWLAVMSTLVRLLTYIMCIVAIPFLEKSEEAIEDQFTLPGGYLIPAIALLLCIWLITHATTEAWLTIGGFTALGTLMYLWSTRRSKTAE